MLQSEPVFACWWSKMPTSQPGQSTWLVRVSNHLITSFLEKFVSGHLPWASIHTMYCPASLIAATAQLAARVGVCAEVPQKSFSQLWRKDDVVFLFSTVMSDCRCFEQKQKYLCDVLLQLTEDTPDEGAACPETDQQCGRRRRMPTHEPF